MQLNQNPIPRSEAVHPELDEIQTIALASSYGEQVAGELKLIERVLRHEAAVQNLELNESDLEQVCRNRQAKISIHNQQNIGEEFERVRLLNMLYEGCLKFLAQSANEFQIGNTGAGRELLKRGDAIIVHLSETLNHEQGGSISSDLDRLYDFAHNHLQEAQNEASAEKVRAVQGIIEKIYLGYLELEIQQDIKLYLAAKRNAV